MSQPITKKYPAAFKERAVKLAVESDQPIAQTARDLGVNENTLHTWSGTYHRVERQEQQVNDEHVYEELKRLCRKFCSGGHEGATALVCGGDYAARAWNCAAAVWPSAPASTSLCFFFILCMSAIPTRVSWPASHALNPNLGRVTRFTPR